MPDAQSSSELWDDDHCPKSQNADGSHCAHVDTHDVCDWCGAHWGEGGSMTVPVAAVNAERAVERARIVQELRARPLAAERSTWGQAADFIERHLGDV